VWGGGLAGRNGPTIACLYEKKIQFHLKYAYKMFNMSNSQMLNLKKSVLQVIGNIVEIKNKANQR
jgi:hypothetical protein